MSCVFLPAHVTVLAGAGGGGSYFTSYKTEKGCIPEPDWFQKMCTKVMDIAHIQGHPTLPSPQDDHYKVTR